jgi:hypothetical protein
MAAATRRPHGHVAGLRRRPFIPTMVDKPSGVIEEPDEDEVSADSVESADAGAEDAGDIAEDLEADSPQDVAEAEPALKEAVDVEPAEPVAVEEPPAAAPGEEKTAEENAAEPVEGAADADDVAEDDEERAEPVEGAADADDIAKHDEKRAEPGRHSELFAWLAGDGESLADLLGSAKQPEPYAPAGPPPPRPAPRPLARPPRLDRQSLRRVTDAPRQPASRPPPLPPSSRAVSPPAKRKERRRTAILVGAVVVAVALVAGVVSLLLPGSERNDTGTAGRRNSTAPAAPQSAQPVVWAKQNLPSGSAIVAPAPLVPGLQAAGFTTVYADDALSGLTLANVAYLVGEPTVTSPAADLEKFVNASAPLAYFGTGSAQTMVGEVFAGGMGAMATAMIADTKLRAQEGSELLKNPNVHTDVAMRKVLANGLLDARAGALIGAFAGAGQVTVTNPVRSAPEAAAGLPYRMFTMSMPNTVFLDNSVRRADPKYKPASVVAVGPNQRRLIWTPAVAPDKPFS